MRQEESRIYYETIAKVKEWLFVLDQVRQEIIILKNRLSSAISQKISRPILDEAELFQQRFINKDQIIELLCYDIILLQSELHQPFKKNVIPIEERIKSIEKDMKNLTYQFNLLKQEFDLYILNTNRK